MHCVDLLGVGERGGVFVAGPVRRNEGKRPGQANLWTPFGGIGYQAANVLRQLYGLGAALPRQIVQVPAVVCENN